MALEDIFRALEEQADSECDAVLDEARAQADGDRRGGGARGRRARAMTARRRRRSALRARTRVAGRSTRRGSRHASGVAAVKERGGERGVRRARSDALGTVRGAADYPAVFRSAGRRGARRASTGEFERPRRSGRRRACRRRSSPRRAVAAAVPDDSSTAGGLSWSHRWRPHHAAQHARGPARQARGARAGRRRGDPVLMSPAAVADATRRAQGKRLRLLRTRACAACARGCSTQAFFEQLMERPDMQQLIQELMQTEYASRPRGGAHPRPDARRRSTRRSRTTWCARTGRCSGSSTTRRATSCTTLLGRWDLFNIKTILRGKHMHLRAEEIDEGLLPVGAAVAGRARRRCVVQDDVRGVVDTLSTWELPYAPALREGYRRVPARPASSPMLELALDRYYAEWAAERLAERGRNYALARADPRHAGRHLEPGHGVPPAEGGHRAHASGRASSCRAGTTSTSTLFRELAAAVRHRRGARPAQGHAVRQAARRGRAAATSRASSIAVFERALEDYLMRKALALGQRRPARRRRRRSRTCGRSRTRSRTCASSSRARPSACRRSG